MTSQSIEILSGYSANIKANMTNELQLEPRLHECDHNHNFRREFSHTQATQGGGGVTITITSNVNSLMHRQRRWGGGGAQKVARYQMIGIFVEFFPIL